MINVWSPEECLSIPINFASFMLSPQKFPLEIMESIIDILATEGDQSFSSIKACSLVSRSLLPCARKHIFSSVTIPSREISYKPWRFSRLILETPEIAQCIVSLTYFAMPADATIVGFSTALSKLTCLKSLSISAVSIFWKDLAFKETILNLMHLPTLNHLKVFDTHGFCVSDLTLCANLKSLEMNHLKFVEGGKDIKIYQDQPPRLESYTYNDSYFSSDVALMRLCTARRTDGRPVVDISGLKKLSLIVKPREVNAVKKWLTLCTQLTEVHLYKSQHLFITRGSADLFLSSIQTLQNIHIHLELELDTPNNVFLPLVAEFASLTGKNVIESIKISIHGFRNYEGTCPAIYANWFALGQVFDDSKSGWGKLRTFFIYITLHDFDFDPENQYQLSEVWKYLKNLPETQFRGIAMNDNIKFHYDLDVTAL